MDKDVMWYIQVMVTAFIVIGFSKEGVFNYQ